MASNAAETLIGAGVLAVAAGFLVYAANTANVDVGGGSYELVGQFRKVEGLSIGGEVQISGVKIGTIRAIELNPKTYYGVVTMSVRDDVKIPTDSSARILSEGLLGGNFVEIEPGVDEFMLEPGAELVHTQGSVNVLDLIQKFGSSSGS